MNSDLSLNEIGVLKRREIEARILAPVLEALGHEFGRERVLEIVSRTVVEVAKEQGNQLAERVAGSGVKKVSEALEPWSRGGALEMNILEESESKLSFDVTRCRYAEMYRELGIVDIGAALSCCRDYSFIEGFDPKVKLVRTQTIMQGASHCDFRYAQSEEPEQK